ncbi:MAG: baseplate J/gp47 family protein [Ruminococcus sp.]|nr:baseplate J/gp47 family protein [Ruminococcus sp.]
MEAYNEIYNRMKAEYESISDTKIDEISDIAIRLKVLAGELYSMQSNLEWVKRQSFLNTATGENLDLLASQRGITRRQATKAKGEITFFISEPRNYAIKLPAGIVAATDDMVPVRFITTENTEISAGNTLVSVYAEAESPGSNGNVKLNTVTVGVQIPSEIDYFYNREPYVGGTDAETDEELRERIRQSYISPPNGTNASYYEQLALSVDGVSKVGIMGKARGTGTVDVYLGGNGVAVSDNALQKVQEVLSKNRELNVDVKAFKATAVFCDLDIVVYRKVGYSSSEVYTICLNAFRDYLASLPLGGTMYLSTLGLYLMNTGCIDNYEFNTSMIDTSIPKSKFLSVGDVNIEVH